MSFSQVILKNLQRRAPRTFMTVAGLAVAVMAVATLWNIAWGYADSAGKYYAARGTDIVVVRAGVSNRLTSSLREELLPTLAGVPGVAAVDGSLTEMVSLGDARLIGIPLRGLKLDGTTLAQLSVREGSTLTGQDSDAVLLGNGLADSLKKRFGTTVEIEGQPFRVAGVFEATNPFDANSIVASLESVQQLMERPQVVSEIQIRVADSSRSDDQLQAICGAIESLRSTDGQPLGLRAQRTQEFVDSATEATLGKAMAWATTAIVISLSLLGMLNTMLMSVLERTRELGILRAIGWRPARVVHLVLGESFVISLIAAGFGLGASWLLLHWMSYWPRTSLLVPYGLSETAMAAGGLAALFAGVAGSVYPAVRASRIPPIEALRHE